jgi:hypothetical protein
MARKIMAAVCIAVVLAALVNFMTLWTESVRLGGTALKGDHSDGHFYLSDHGVKTEVTEEVWRHSRWHSLSVAVTHPLGMLAMACLLFQYIFPALMFRGPKADIAATEVGVRERGPALATTRCGGRIGAVNMSTPLLKVVIYRQGLWLKPIFTAPFAIPTAQIRRVAERGGWPWEKIEISHDSTQFASPVLLFYRGDRAMITRLKELVTV